MNKPLRIPIFFKSDEELENASLEELGISVPSPKLEESKVKDMLFYRLGAIAPFQEEDGDPIFSRIFVEGEDFLSSILFKDFENFVNEQLNEGI